MVDLQDDISTFDGRHSLTNSLIVGTYLRMVADGRERLARAWISCRVSWGDGETPLAKGGRYSKNPRLAEVLRLLPVSSEACEALRADSDYVRNAVWEFAGGVDDEDALRSSAVWVEVSDPITPSAEERRDDLLNALARADGDSDAEAVTFRELLDHAVLGWSAVAKQRVQHFAVAGYGPAEVAEAKEAIEAVRERFKASEVMPASGRFNNWSFASNAPGPELLALAATAASRTTPPFRLGVIVPGPHQGRHKAKSDIADLYHAEGISIDERTVRRGDEDFAAQMAEAIPQLSLRNDGLLIAYGGGEAADLARVRNAIREPLRSTRIPAWVAVGHADYRFEISNPLVRVCRTPSDARALLLAETVDYTRALKRITQRWLNRLGGPSLPAAAAATLMEEIGALKSSLSGKVEQHAQGPER